MSESESDKSRAQVRLVQISADYAGQRLDNYLLRELKGVPKTRLYRAMRKGEIRVNKGRVKADYRLAEGDLVRIPPLRLPQRDDLKTVPQRWRTLLEERTLFEDKGLLVINKPSGLAVHGGSGLSFGLIECLRLLRPNEPYMELVHRLDRETSGCILIARKSSVLKDLHRQLRSDGVKKSYLALVRGSWPRQRRFVEAPLQKNTLKSGERVVRVEQGGKAARTEFSVLQRLPGFTLMEARPITGRTHQIRVHALHAGYPLVGDDKYGDRDTNQAARSRGLRRLFLHASQLSFSNREGNPFSVQAPLDKELKKFLESISN